MAIDRQAEMLSVQSTKLSNHKVLRSPGQRVGGRLRILGSRLHPLGHFRPMSSSVKPCMTQIVNRSLTNIDCFEIAFGSRTKDLKLAVFGPLAPIPSNGENL